MPDRPLVSVVTIFLNRRDTLREAIESLFAQTFRDWELVLVDDGSSDGSSKLAREYAARFPARVSYHDHPGHENLGIGVTRNLGYRLATGKYVAYLDADDVWLPNKLARQVAIMEMHPEVGMVYENSLYWYSWSDVPPNSQPDFSPRLGVRPGRIYGPPYLLPHFLEGTATVPIPSSILVRRTVLEELGGFEASFRDMYEDQAFYAKIALRYPIYVAGTYACKYRQHPGASSAIAEQTGRAHTSRLAFLGWLEAYLREEGIAAPEVWLALRRESWLYARLLSLQLPGRLMALAMWTRKWTLRLEKSFLPHSARCRLWVAGKQAREAHA